MINFEPVNLAYDCYESACNPNLSPIIFLHGFASDRKTFRHCLQPIAEETRRKVYAFDARHYGESDYTDEFHLSLNVDDLFHFMDTINAPKAILVGHSMGGSTASYAALKKPDRIEMFISEDASIGEAEDNVIALGSDYIRALSKSIQEIPRNMQETEALKFVMDDMFDSLSDENKAYTPLHVLYKHHIPFKRLSDGYYKLLINEDVVCKVSQETYRVKLPLVGIYEGPAIFLVGTASPQDVKGEADYIRKYFPNAEFIDFIDASHSIHSQCLQDFIDTIVQVCNRECHCGK